MARPNLVLWSTIDRRLRPETNPQRFARRVLAEGDSWFTVGGEPPWNLLHSIDYPDDNIVVSLAKPGDTLRSMADICNNPELTRALSTRFGFKWHAILLSGGGNDLIEYASQLIIPATQRAAARPADAADYYFPERVDEVMRYIERGYRMIAALRDAPESANRATPIITHTYDWATPTDAAAKLAFLTVGPWLSKAFRKGGIPVADWIAASDYLLGRLRRVLLDLGRSIARFHVVDTAGTLVRAELGATGNSNDWLNEIHPNRSGYDKLALRVEPVLDRVLGA
jgi:hypothetical protein